MPKCQCLYCNVHLEFDESQENQDVVCPQCGQTTSLFIRRPVVPVKTVQPQAEPAQLHFEPSASIKAHLASVRSSTCYKALRSVIGVCFFIWELISALIVVMGGFEFFETLYTDGVAEVGLGLLFISIGLLSGVLCAASWQATILLVDIADLLVRISNGRQA